MLADGLLDRLDQARDSALTDECDRSERLALAVWWLVDRLSQELDLDPSEAAGQVQIMAALAAEQMLDQGTECLLSRCRKDAN
jgi:hypothetical protein